MIPGSNVRQVPVYLYNNIPESTDAPFEKRTDLLVVGGFKHSPNTDAVMWLIREILPLIRQELPDVKLYIVGRDPPESLMALASELNVITGAISDDELKSLYTRTRLALVPLRYGAGVKGKTVEAMANGLPIVSTSIGVEGIPGSENIVEVADDACAFAQKVIFLYTDSTRWNGISEKSLQYVAKHFSNVNVDTAMNDFLPAALNKR